jgi:hypothetical protein
MRNNGDDHQNRPRKHGLTQAEREAVRQRYAEGAELRKTASEINFVRALAAGRALKERGL